MLFIIGRDGRGVWSVVKIKVNLLLQLPLPFKMSQTLSSPSDRNFQKKSHQTGNCGNEHINTVCSVNNINDFSISTLYNKNYFHSKSNALSKGKREIKLSSRHKQERKETHKSVFVIDTENEHSYEP